MAKKKRRPPKRKPRKQPAGPRSDWGYYLFQDSGVSVAYVAKANEDGSVDAALFGVDTWRDGLIGCYGCRFETKEAFEEAMQARSDAIKPSTKFRCQEEIAYGWRIRTRAEAELPSEFARWRHLVDPLEDVRLPAYIYRCPGCGGRLPDYVAEQLLEAVDGEIMYYLVCDRCKRPGRRPRSAQYAGIKHMETFSAVEVIDEFSVTWDQDYLPALTQVPVNPTIADAVKMLISQNDAMKAACMAIETHIACASVPNDAVEDRHVLAALQAVLSGVPLPETEDDESDPAAFLAGAIRDGIQMFNKAMRFRGWSTRRHVNSALEWVIESVNTHSSGRNPRSYIQFIKRFVPV